MDDSTQLSISAPVFSSDIILGNIGASLRQVSVELLDFQEEGVGDQDHQVDPGPQDDLEIPQGSEILRNDDRGIEAIHRDV